MRQLEYYAKSGTNVTHMMIKGKKKFAPGEARTHGLQIMRLTRCLLRYGGITRENLVFYMCDRAKIISPSFWKQKRLLPMGGLEPPIFRSEVGRLVH